MNNTTPPFVAIAMLAGLALAPPSPEATSDRGPRRCFPAKAISPEERAKRRAKKKAAEASRRRNHK